MNQAFQKAIAIGSLALATIGSAQAAQPVFEIRAISVAVWSGVNPASTPAPTASFFDGFANGDPFSGGSFTGAATPSPLYGGTYGTLSPNAEMAGPAADFFGTAYGLGSLKFSVTDATPSPTSLDPVGMVSNVVRLKLREPAAGSHLLTNASSFDINQYWTFSQPTTTSSYGMRLTDNNTPGAAYNDLLDMRVITGGALGPQVQMRRLSFDGVATTSSTGIASMPIANTLASGKTMADVALIDLEFSHLSNAYGGNDSVLGTFTLLDASGQSVGGYAFLSTPQLFHGESWTQAMFGANWSMPIPEPSTVAVSLLGLLGVAARTTARRRKA